MKKLFTALLCLAMLITCICPATAEAAMTPGTYSITQRGYSADFTIAVTVDETNIQSIEIVESLDSLGIGEMAQKELAKTVVEKQSTKVDTYSGATISSVTFLSAVRNALKAAGASDDMLATDYTTPRFTSKATAEGFEPDVIVVGGGLAGVVSAMTAVEEGSKVLLIEQANYLGGTSMYAGGAIAQSGSMHQPAESHNAITADSLYTWLTMSNRENENFHPELARAMADASAPAYDKLVEWGMKPAEMTFFGNGAGYYVWQDSGEYKSTGWHIFHNLEPKMEEMIDAGKLVILMRTKGTGLVQDESGAVTGVTTADGKTYNADAVILATGGFTNNLELMEKIYSRFASYSAGTATGEMQQAAIALGAKTYAMDMTRWEPGMVNVTGKNNAQVEYEVVVATSGYVWVNKDGKRVSVEDAKNAAPWKSAENNTMYILLDQELVDTTTVLKLGNASNSQMDAGNVRFHNLLEQGKCIWSGATIEEVAQKAGVDAAALAATVETYNGYCAAGEDKEFGRKPENLKSLEGPFYLIETIGGVKGTSGGLLTDANACVITADDQVIPGLYAAGEICGTLAFNGNCVYNGGCYIICSSFGRIAAIHASDYAAGK